MFFPLDAAGWRDNQSTHDDNHVIGCVCLGGQEHDSVDLTGGWDPEMVKSYLHDISMSMLPFGLSKSSLIAFRKGTIVQEDFGLRRLLSQALFTSLFKLILFIFYRIVQY